LLRRRSTTVTYERVFLEGTSEDGEVFMAGKFEIYKDKTGKETVTALQIAGSSQKDVYRAWR
jgi:hypothetical protein